MDLNLIREQASALHSGALEEQEYLQQIVGLIVRNKNHLPQNISHSLHEAFGTRKRKASLHTHNDALSLNNHDNALSRVKGLAKDDLKIPEYLSDAIPKYEQNGDLFWAGESSNPVNTNFGNVLADLWHSNKRNTIANGVRRAFYCVALYRVLRRVMDIHKAKRMAYSLASFCADKILDVPEPEKLQKEDIIDELRSDFKIGSKYDSYTRKGKDGILFHLLVLPGYMYEKYLNKTKDVETVLAHFDSIGFRPEESTESAAASIMKVISDRFDDQVAIFTPIRYSVNPTHKHGLPPQPSPMQVSKRPRKHNEVNASRTAHSGDNLLAVSRSTEANPPSSSNTLFLTAPPGASNNLNMLSPQVDSCGPVDNIEGTRASTNRESIPVDIVTPDAYMTHSDPPLPPMISPGTVEDMMHIFQEEDFWSGGPVPITTILSNA